MECVITWKHLVFKKRIYCLMLNELHWHRATRDPELEAAPHRPMPRLGRATIGAFALVVALRALRYI